MIKSEIRLVKTKSYILELGHLGYYIFLMCSINYLLLIILVTIGLAFFFADINLYVHIN